MTKKTFPLLLRRFIYSFPIQLMVMYAKKNKSFLLFWILLFGIITENFGTKYGLQFLFLNPEYLGRVSFTSFFIVGMMIGLYIVAFNISGFLLNSFRFPFLATLSRILLKFFLNNFIIPTTFVFLYCYRIYEFQSDSQLKSLTEITIDISGLLAGITVIIFLSLRYFNTTNDDIQKLFGVNDSDKNDQLPTRDYTKIDKKLKDSWRVETYLSSFHKIKLVRESGHYHPYMLQKVFRQNHLNVAVFEIILIILFLSLGFFGESPNLKIPAGASILLTMTILLMIAGVIRYWLKAWATPAMILILIVINFLSRFDFISPKTYAYGIDNAKNTIIYSEEKLETQYNETILSNDIQHTEKILNNWKQYWKARGVGKPKLVILEASGGGLRSMLFTFKSLQVIDSTCSGSLMKNTAIMFGSSGGMLSESYYRELFWKQKEKLMQDDFSGKQQLIDSLGNDMLNSIIFNGVVADLFLNPSRVKVDGSFYAKDRAYAWEQQFNENTQNLLAHPISDYILPEQSASIPMLVVSPTILNSGGALHISAQPVSYLLNSSENTHLMQLPSGIEFTRFFKSKNSYNLRMSSALRMNAAFPYVTPATTLPCNPSIEVLDAGLHDNYGTQNAIQFIYSFKKWIQENTSGVVLLQIRDTPKKLKIKNNSAETFFEKTTAPVQNLSDNFLVMQDYVSDKLICSISMTKGIPFEYVLIQMPDTKERVSLNWHLTEKEKKMLLTGIYSKQNTEALAKLKSILITNQ